MVLRSSLKNKQKKPLSKSDRLWQNFFHPHPGPSSASSDTANISTLSSTLSSLHTLGLSRHLSFVNYNVQSIILKLDTIMAELSDFDILAFSETRLNAFVTKDDILLLY